MAKYTPAQNKSAQKYSRSHYDTYTIRFPKGDREKYKEHAKSRGASLARLITNLLEQDIKEH